LQRVRRRFCKVATTTARGRAPNGALRVTRTGIELAALPLRHSTEGGEPMSKIEQSIDVNVPVRTAYNQWTQFEEFPKFMDGITEVKQLSDTRLRWRSEIGGVEETWEAEIDQQVPDMRIAWHSVTGARNAGAVTFHRLSDTATRVMLQIDYDPEGIVENVGDALGAVSLRVKGDLQRFKEFIEALGSETGAWRGTVQAHQ
jgi:uncharacterized membrane protein